MHATLIDILFGCWHRNYSFPITFKGRCRNAATSGMYVVCLDCGRELPYDWNEMRVASGRAIRPLEAPEKLRGQPSGVPNFGESLQARV